MSEICEVKKEVLEFELYAGTTDPESDDAQRSTLDDPANVADLTAPRRPDERFDVITEEIECWSEDSSVFSDDDETMMSKKHNIKLYNGMLTFHEEAAQKGWKAMTLRDHVREAMTDRFPSLHKDYVATKPVNFEEEWSTENSLTYPTDHTLTRSMLIKGEHTSHFGEKIKTNVLMTKDAEILVLDDEKDVITTVIPTTLLTALTDDQTQYHRHTCTINLDETERRADRLMRVKLDQFPHITDQDVFYPVDEPEENVTVPEMSHADQENLNECERLLGEIGDLKLVMAKTDTKLGKKLKLLAKTIAKVSDSGAQQKILGQVYDTEMENKAIPTQMQDLVNQHGALTARMIAALGEKRYGDSGEFHAHEKPLLSFQAISEKWDVTTGTMQRIYRGSYAPGGSQLRKKKRHPDEPHKYITSKKAAAAQSIPDESEVDESLIPASQPQKAEQHSPDQQRRTSKRRRSPTQSD